MLRALNKRGPDKGRLHQEAPTLGHPTPGLPRMQPKWHACYGYLFLGGSVVKNPSANTGDAGSIPGWGRSPGGGNGNPLQYSCLENPMDRGAWWATVHGVAKSWAQLSDWARACTHTHTCHFSHWLHYHPLLSRPLRYFSSLQESSFCAAVNSQPQGPVYRTNKSAWGRQKFPEFLAWPDQLLPGQCGACHISQVTKWLFLNLFSQGHFSKKVLRKINDAPTGFHGKCSPDFLNCLWESNLG